MTAKAPLLAASPLPHCHLAATETMDATCSPTSIEDEMNNLTIHSNVNVAQQEQMQQGYAKGPSEGSRGSGHASSNLNSNAPATPTGTTPFNVIADAANTDVSSVIHVDNNDEEGLAAPTSLPQTRSTSTISTGSTSISTKKSLKLRLRKIFRKRPGRKKSSRSRRSGHGGGGDSQSELSTQNSMLSLGTIDLESNRSATHSHIDIGGTEDFPDVDYPYDSNYEDEAEYDFNPDDDEYRNDYGGNIMTMRLYEGDETAEHYSTYEDMCNNSKINNFGFHRTYSSTMNTTCTKKSQKDHNSSTIKQSSSPTPENKSHSKTSASTSPSAPKSTPLSKPLNAIYNIDDGIVPSEVNTPNTNTSVRLQTPPSWQQQWQRQQPQIHPLHQMPTPTKLISARDDSQHQSSLYEMGKSYYAQGLYDKAYTAQMEALQSLYEQSQKAMSKEVQSQSKSKSKSQPQSHPHLRQEAMIRYEIAKIKYAHYMDRTANSDGNPYDQSKMRKIRCLQDRVESTKCQVSLQNLHFYQCQLQDMDARVEGHSGNNSEGESDGGGDGEDGKETSFASFDLNDVYQRLHILHTLGKLCNEGLHRYEEALGYYQRALDIEDQMMQLWKRGCLNSVNSAGSSKSVTSTSMTNNVTSSSDNDAEMREWAARIRHSRMKIGSIHYTRGRFDLALYSST